MPPQQACGSVKTGYRRSGHRELGDLGSITPTLTRSHQGGGNALKIRAHPKPLEGGAGYRRASPLILPARLQAEGVLAIHRADGIPIEADMASDGVDVAPGALHRVAEKEAVAA